MGTLEVIVLVDESDKDVQIIGVYASAQEARAAAAAHVADELDVGSPVDVVKLACYRRKVLVPDGAVLWRP